jgi:general secretion pathway protein G
MNRNRTHRRNAFTLIELLLVLVILAVLAAVVVPKFVGRSEQARITAAKTQISGFETALTAFEVDCGRFPTNDEGLDALVRQPANVQNWKAGGYMKSVPKDPWGNAYVYKYPGTHNPNEADIYSLGPDGREGGSDDITNWEAQQ